MLLLRGNQLFFSVRDYNPDPIDLEAILIKGASSTPETGYNLGMGICGVGYLTIQPRSTPRMMNYKIDSTAGLHYSGIWLVEY